jgi:hypothetical protein
MHADTNSIRGFSGSNIDLGTDIRAAAAALCRDLGPSVTDALGPVGARFAHALGDAAEALMTSVNKLGDEVLSHGSATAAAAGQYDEAELRAQARVANLTV